jgi:hypothetical protein
LIIEANKDSDSTGDYVKFIIQGLLVFYYVWFNSYLGSYYVKNPTKIIVTEGHVTFEGDSQASVSGDKIKFEKVGGEFKIQVSINDSDVPPKFAITFDNVSFLNQFLI